MCCIHCPKPTPEEAEDAAFRESVAALRRERSWRAVQLAINAAKPVVNVTFQNHPPRFQVPSTPDPDRPRGL